MSKSNNMENKTLNKSLNANIEDNGDEMDAQNIMRAIDKQKQIKSESKNISGKMTPDSKVKVEKPVTKIVIDGCVYEQIYNPETKEAGFAFYDATEKQCKIVPYVDDRDIRFVPIVDDFVDKKVVYLPTGIQQYESEAKLLDEIQTFIHKYLDISEADEKICTWMVVTFCLFDKLNIMIPYLRALGDTGCGKSRLLDVVGGICYRPMPVGGSMTPAILFRVAEKWKGTMIIDEADWKNTDEYSEVIKIINLNQPNRPILRCKGDNYDKIEAFDSWCPRILATRRNFSDVATESRMLTIQMKESMRTDIPIALDDEFYNKQTELRNKLLLYRLMNWNRVNSSIKPNVDFTGIEPRSQQIMYPIAIVFNHNQDILNELVKMARSRQSELIKDRSSTDDGIIANAYLELLDNGYTNITSTDIVNLLGNKGQDMSPQSIGHCMKSLGFTTTVKNVGGETKRCYNSDQKLIERLRNRYSLKSPRVQVEQQEKLQRLQKLQPNGWRRVIQKIKREVGIE